MTIPSSRRNGRAVNATQAKPNISAALRIPSSLGNASLLDTALAYAEAGWFVVPVKPGTKNPGSLIGGWATQSTRDGETIRGWWEKWPDAGIALHTGRSGAIVFDLDEASLAEVPLHLRESLRQGAFQQTRRGNNERGHYVFALADGERFGNSAGAFAPYGDVRGHNGVILAEPTVHPSPDGHYCWPAPGVVPPLPDPLRACLRAPGEKASRAAGAKLMKGLADGAPSTAVAAVLADSVCDLTGDEGSRHELTCGNIARLIRLGEGREPGVRTALAALKAAYVAVVGPDRAGGERTADADFDRLVEGGSQLIAADSLLFIEPEVIDAALAPGGLWHRDTPYPGQNREALRARGLLDADGKAIVRGVLEVLGPEQWAAEVEDPEFLVAGVLCRDTFGVNAGPKKSLKTHDNQALALAVATGSNLYLSERFPVRNPGKVLYIVGEGGVVPVRRTLRRMARAYGLDPQDIARDPAFPLVAAFGSAPIDDPTFRDELKRLLDVHQPTLVLLESFYNFHPAGVEAGNLYQRGAVLDEYHKFVRAQCVGATSLITDHYRSTAGKNLDLDSISMAGQAENADSWVTRYHRQPPDVAAGNFWLRVGFNSRQWGGSEMDVDWDLGVFDHTRGCHVGEIGWSVESAGEGQPGGSAAGKTGDQHTPEGRERLVLEFVAAHPATSKTAACEALAGQHRVGDKKFREAWAALEASRTIEQVDGSVPQIRNGQPITKRAKVWQQSSRRVRIPADLEAGVGVEEG